MIKRLSFIIILLMCFGASSPAQAVDFLGIGGLKYEAGQEKISFAFATQITPTFWTIGWLDGEGDNLEGNIDFAMVYDIFWRFKGGVLAGPGIDRTPTSYYTFGYGLILGICITEDIGLWGAVKRNENWNEDSQFGNKNTFFFGASAKL